MNSRVRDAYRAWCEISERCKALSDALIAERKWQDAAWDVYCRARTLVLNRSEQQIERERLCPSNHWNTGNDTCADCGADLR